MLKHRDIIIVLGKTGQGKSVWTRKYIETKKRLFAFDPIQDINCQYIAESQLLEMYDGGFFDSGKSFRVGMFHPDYLPLLGSISFLSGECCLAIEEAAMAFPAGNYVIDSWLREAVFLGRHRALSLVVTAQRAVSIPIILRSQATRIVSFAQQEGSDIRWLYEYFGSRANEICDLPKLTCLDSEHGEISRYSLFIDQKQGEEKEEISKQNNDLEDEEIY